MLQVKRAGAIAGAVVTAFTAMAFGQVDIYRSSFESDDGGWVGTGNWERGIPTGLALTGCDSTAIGIPPTAFDGQYVWATGVTTCYSNCTCEMTLSRTIDLTTAINPTLRYHWWKDVNGNFDYTAIHVVPTGMAPDLTNDSTCPTSPASTTAILEQCDSATSTSWVEEIVDLGAFEGQVVDIYFSLRSSGTVNHPGWYIDDVRVTSDLTPTPGDLGVVLEDAPDPVGNIGDPITYTVVVTNADPSPVSNVTVTTTLDGATNFVSSTDGFHDGSPSGGVHTATFASLPALSVTTYDIVVNTTQLGVVSAMSVVNSPDVSDPDTSNNLSVANTEVNILTDLAVTISDSPDPIHTAGTEITYQVQVTNNGPLDANNVVLTVDLPPQSTFVLANHGSHDGSPMGGTLTVNYPVIFSGFSESVSVRVAIGVNGQYVATASADSDEGDPVPGNSTASTTTTVDISADLAVDLKASTHLAVGTADPVHYFLDITNAGPGPVANVPWTITLPAGTAYLTSTDGVHDGAPAGGVVSGVASSIDVGGLYEVTVFTQTVGTLGEAGAAVANTPGGTPVDDNQANNTSTSRPLTVLANTDDYGRLVFADNLADQNFGPFDGAFPPSLGVKYASFDKPFISPDGTKFIIQAVTDTGVTNNDEILVLFDGTTLHTVAEEGVSVFSDVFDFVGPIDQKLGINDNAEFVFATNTFTGVSPEPTINDEIIVKGGVSFLTVIAREGNPFPDGGFLSYGTGLESPSITNTGDVYFMADTDDPTTTVDEYFVKTDDDGLTVTTLLQEGVTAPGNQVGGGIDVWAEIDIDDVWVTGDGMHNMILGDLEPGTANDEILAYDNNAVIQENLLVHPLIGDTADTGTPVDAIFLAHNGDWYARGSNNNDVHWVVKNGEPIAISGQPIYPGATENWRAETATTFFFVVGDHRGNYVVGGFTDSTDELSDVVLVLNGERVVSREFDPIDMDGNGFFDDSRFNNGGPVFISTYGNDDGIITEDGRLIVVATTRLISTTPGNHNGDVVISIPLDLDGGAVCVCETDGNAAQVNVFDLLAYLDLWFAQAGGADIDGTTGVNVFDLLFFLDCWFPASAGSPCP